jgi:hypothetical protein
VYWGPSYAVGRVSADGVTHARASSKKKSNALLGAPGSCSPPFPDPDHDYNHDYTDVVRRSRRPANPACYRPPRPARDDERHC